MNRKFASYAAGLLVGTFLATPAFAQDDTAEAPDAAADENVIIVTATKRAQDVQDIPLAVTAVSPAQLEAQGVVNVQDIGSVASSFSSSQAQNSNGTVVLRIRGIGTTSNNIGFESAVGIFVDGAYQSRPGVALSEFVDVERVEVLRGPQGTLFGRNTSAGALNITNKRPELGEFGGFVNATYGNFDHMSLQGAINVPLAGDTVAARVTGAYRKRDGFVTVLDRNGDFLEDSNNVDQFLVRGQIGWETDGGFRGRLIADYSESDGTCCAAVEVYRSPLEATPLFSNFGLGARGGMAHEVPATNPFDTGAAQDAVDRRTATASRLHPSHSDQWGIVAEMEYPIGDSADLFYIGSYREYDNQESYDSAFSGLDLFNVLPGGGTAIDTMTHELRLQGEAMDGRINWLIGGYYSDEDITQEVNFGLGADYNAFAAALLAGGTAGITPPAGIFVAAATNGLPGLNPADPLAYLSGGGDASASTSTAFYEQKSKSWSIFTNNSFEVADGLELTVGLRYSDESKDGRFDQLASNNPACLGFLNGGLGRLGTVVGAAGVPGPGIAPTVTALAPTAFVLSCFPFVAPAIGTDAIPLPLPREFDSTFSDKELIYTGKIGYDFGDVNAYASYTHGFKSGGFNLDITAAAGGADPRFASEEVDAYEFGIKGRFLDNAVTANLAIFYEDFSNFQVLEFTGSQFQTFNVPKAISKGFELETQIRPSRTFTVDLGVTYADAYYPEDCAAPTDAVRVQTLCGFQHTNAPKWVTIAGATYRNDFGGDLEFFLNGQLRAESDRRTSTQAIEVPSATAIANAGSVEAAIAASPRLPFDVQDGNVKVNLRAGIGDIDEAWVIEAWVTNLTNEVTRGITFNTTLRSGSRSAFTQEPRMYGITLRGKF